MDSLVAAAWRLYHDAEATPCVVRPSIPILYFGDHERYARSRLKIITVGLNPSRGEFPVDEPFKRFLTAQHVYPDILNGSCYPDYLGALNDYFRCDPYMGWFGSLEPLLGGMDAGYRGSPTNTALHTDICSPLATDPTWSKLSHERAILGPDGVQLWLRLVRHLAPDVILISVARQHLTNLDFPTDGPWQIIYTIECANPYHIEAREVEVVSGKSTLIVFGQAAQKPFGTVSNAAKGDVGKRIAERVNER